jgi:hypothetical protein
MIRKNRENASTTVLLRYLKIKDSMWDKGEKPGIVSMHRDLCT